MIHATQALLSTTVRLDRSMLLIRTSITSLQLRSGDFCTTSLQLNDCFRCSIIIIVACLILSIGACSVATRAITLPSPLLFTFGHPAHHRLSQTISHPRCSQYTSIVSYCQHSYAFCWDLHLGLLFELHICHYALPL